MAKIPAMEMLTTGRGGVMLPNYEWRDGDAPYQMDNFRNFFHAFWEANGVELVTSKKSSYDRSTEQVPMLEELVLPADGDKPLTVVRASYTPRLQSAINYDRESDRRRNDYEQWGVSLGTEKHQLLIPPVDGAKPFDAVLSLKEEHRTGRTRDNQSGVRLMWQGKDVFARDYEAEREQFEDVRNWHTASSESVAQGLQPILQEIIEYIS